MFSAESSMQDFRALLQGINSKKEYKSRFMVKIGAISAPYLPLKLCFFMPKAEMLI